MLLDPAEPEDPGDTSTVDLTEFSQQMKILDVFPNPAKDVVAIRHRSGETLAPISSIRIFKGDGTLYKTISPLSVNGEEIVNLRDISPGIYLVQLLIDGRVAGIGKILRE